MAVRDEVMRRAFAVLPEGVLRRVLRDGPPFEGVEQHPTPAVPTAARRLFIGPLNSAGQGDRWARAAAELPDVAAQSMAIEYGSPFRFPVGQSVPQRTYRWSRGWQRAQRAAVGGFTHVIVESGARLFGDYFPGSVSAEVRALERAGLRVGLMFHGSDIRHPDRHGAFEVWSPFPGDPTLAQQLVGRVRENERLIAELGIPVFVSTPDLLVDVPNATWVPIVIDVERWTSSEVAPLQDERLTVVHVPSNPVIKGTPLVDACLRDLDAAGIITYVYADGVAAADMPALYQRADIVVDQFRIGNYGVAAAEAMASGRVVVSHVNDYVRSRATAAAGSELPIVEATPDTLASVIRDIAANRDAYRDIAARGPSFVRSLHDGHASARALGEFLGDQHARGV